MADVTVQRETEIKLPVDDLDQLRTRLAELGASRVGARSFESNTLFDHPDRRLRRSDRALRVRRCEGRTVLTFKGPATWLQGVRDREEIEVEVMGGEALQDVLRGAGLEPSFRYEKWRESWRLASFAVVLDDTPMGSFVEIEGSRERLPEVAQALGLDPASAAQGSYPSLWVDHRRRHPELDLPTDMVFDAP